MIYDIAIVGAGPAGLMAARTALEKELKVVLIEQREDVSNITRACCMQFIMDEGYENETIEIKQGKVIFPNNGFEVDYQGPTAPMIDKYYISPKGHKIHFAYPDKRPILIKFDKGLLLKGIIDKCERLGVEFRGGTHVYDAKDRADGVVLKMRSKGVQSTVKAKKLIAADGANAGIAESLGMNKERQYFATAQGIIYSIEGLKDFEHTAWKSYYGLAYQSYAPVMISASLLGENVATVIVIGNKNAPPETVYENLKTKSPLAYMFENTKTVHTLACVVKAFTSLKIPYGGNSLIIGDAGAYVEIQTQGALMCGYHAGNAVAKELVGEAGFEEYTEWWQKSFEFNSDDFLRVAQGYALVPTYTDDDLDYLFSLTEDEVLEGTYSQYKSPKLMWDSILRHEKKIATKRPEIYEKIKGKKLTLSDVL